MRPGRPAAARRRRRSAHPEPRPAADLLVDAADVLADEAESRHRDAEQREEDGEEREDAFDLGADDEPANEEEEAEGHAADRDDACPRGRTPGAARGRSRSSGRS